MSFDPELEEFKRLDLRAYAAGRGYALGSPESIALLFNDDSKFLGRSQDYELEECVLRITNKFGANPLAREKRAGRSLRHPERVWVGYQPLALDVTS